jgi:hypothetical protein
VGAEVRTGTATGTTTRTRLNRVAPGRGPSAEADVDDRLVGYGETALITGDCVRHPVRFAHPVIGSCVHIDPEQSEESCRKLFNSP